MVVHSLDIVNDVANLNDHFKTNLNMDKALTILQQLRLLVNQLTLNLHDLNKDIYYESNNDIENEKYYYMTMYESLINSIKSMISMYENHLLNKNEKNDVNLKSMENKLLSPSIYDVNELKLQRLLDDLKNSNNNSLFFNPNELMQDLKVNELKKNIQFVDNINEQIIAEENKNNIFNIKPNQNPFSSLDPLFANPESNAPSIDFPPLISHILPEGSNNSKKIKIIFLCNKRLPQSFENIWESFKKLNKTDCIKIDPNKHERLAEKLDFDFSKDFEIKKVIDKKVDSFDDELSLDKIVQFARPETIDGYESDIEDIMPHIDYDNVLTLYHNPSCIHCQKLYPKWDELIRLYKNKPIQLLKVDCKKNADLCFDITHTPTIMFKNMKINNISEFLGKNSVEEISKFIDVNMQISDVESNINQLPSECQSKNQHKNLQDIINCPSCNNDMNHSMHDMNHSMHDMNHSMHDMNHSMHDMHDMHDMNDSMHGMNDGINDSMNDMDGMHGMHGMNDGMNDSMNNMDGMNNLAQLNDIPDFSLENLDEHQDLISTDKPILIFYYKEDCKYSKEFENIWESLKNKLDITFIKQDYNTLSDDMKSKIKEIPTLDLVLDLYKNGKMYRYGNKDIMDEQKLMEFIASPETGSLQKVNSSSIYGGYKHKYKNNSMYGGYKHKYSNNSMYGGAKGKGKIILFYADWCGHCQQFKPLWEKIKRKMGKKVTFEEVDDENVFEINKYGVQGYPTIIAEKAGKMFKFNDDRSESTLIDFIEKKVM